MKVHIVALVFQTLKEIDLPYSRVAVSEDDGLCISFQSGDLYCDIELYEDEKILVGFSNRAYKPRIYEISEREVRRTLSKFKRYLNGEE